LGDEVEFHTPSLRSSGKGLSDAGGRVDQEWKGLKNTVQGMGDMFGDDMVSSLIQMTYQIAQEMADESYTSAGEQLKYLGEGLNVMADIYDKTEDATTQTFDRFGKAM